MSDPVEEAFNYKFSIAPESLEDSFKKYFPNYAGLSRGEPGGFVLSDYFMQHAERLFRFKPRPDDVWVVTFPKCGESPHSIKLIFKRANVLSSCSGTTWTQELVWMVVNNCDEATAASIPLALRAPFLEYDNYFGSDSSQSW